MHPLTFQFKRAHLSAVAFGRKIFRGTKRPEDPDFDGVPLMTPARFDILTIVHGRPARWEGKRTRGSALMADITAQLGLSRATVSKAVKRLVELELVTTERMTGRTKLVSLTAKGLALIHRAFHKVFTERRLSRHVRHFFSTRLGRCKTNRVAAIDEVLEESWLQLFDLAHHLGDRADYVYLFRRVDAFL